MKYKLEVTEETVRAIERTREQNKRITNRQLTVPLRVQEKKEDCLILKGVEK